MNKLFPSPEAIRPRPWRLAFVYFLLFVSVTNCKHSTDPDVVETPSQIGQLTVGESKAGVSQQIGARGGVVQISDPASPLNGFKIEVPSGAYAENRVFNVSYAPLQKHDFGPDFTALSPLITVENGGDFAQLPMSISIPIQLPANHQACVFMFDDTGDFSVLPTRNLLPSQITVDASHFTQTTPAKGGRTGIEKGRKLLVVSSRTDILNAVKYNTGFKPGVDDWGFPNYGSYAYPDGLCSGMAVTSLWYFNYKRNQSGNGSLRTDKTLSNPYFEKPDDLFVKNRYWGLNDTGIKFASMVQVVKSSLISNFYKNIIGFIPDAYTYYNMAFYFKYNKNAKPDYMLINRKDGSGSHAILIVGKTVNGLLVADPNKTEVSELKFSNFTFEDYLATQNLNDLPSVYNGFYLIPEIDYKPVEEKWKEVENRTIGQGCFPDYSSYELITENKKTKFKNDLLIFSDFSLSNPNKSTKARLYAVDASNKVSPLGEDTVGKIYSIPNGTRKIGILATATTSRDCAGNEPTSKGFQWAGVTWYTVQAEKLTIKALEDISIENPGVINKSYGFIMEGNYTFPSGTVFSWNFGDGSSGLTYSGNNKAEHTFTKTGTYTIKLTILRPSGEEYVFKKDVKINYETSVNKIFFSLNGTKIDVPAEPVNMSGASIIYKVSLNSKVNTNPEYAIVIDKVANFTNKIGTYLIDDYFMYPLNWRASIWIKTKAPDGSIIQKSYGSLSGGQFKITYLDMTKNIIEGTFSFDARDPSSKEFIKITDGFFSNK
ncbi:PKD domain-containing protein [Fibrella forsythiae]|uniref:PKD domain-containing protein n=1 Tax=Fibrella forsythiae TaxID=2817061 RepID=A0ABS3JSP6_9BACT|nr:PKD domain-containing protein [Fibrella forsythiae]MBO0953021.1 PKD domain-containing protein [Fibrella forsythiae]